MLKPNFWKIFPNFYIKGVIVIEVIFCIRLLLHHKTFKIKSMVLFLGSLLWKRAKNDHFHEGGKVKKKLFSVDSCDVKSMSFKLGNDIFIIFEMPMSSYQRNIDKNNISLLFRPSVITGPWMVPKLFIFVWNAFRFWCLNVISLKVHWAYQPFQH